MEGDDGGGDGGDNGDDGADEDSGGSELDDNLVCRWTLVGVTSFGVDCARPDFPGKKSSNSLQFEDEYHSLIGLVVTFLMQVCTRESTST